MKGVMRVKKMRNDAVLVAVVVVVLVLGEMQLLLLGFLEGI